MDFKGVNNPVARLPFDGKLSWRAHVARFCGMLQDPYSMKEILVGNFAHIARQVSPALLPGVCWLLPDRPGGLFRND
jgi:hypothetical protein